VTELIYNTPSPLWAEGEFAIITKEFLQIQLLP